MLCLDLRSVVYVSTLAFPFPVRKDYNLAVHLIPQTVVSSNQLRCVLDAR